MTSLVKNSPKEVQFRESILAVQAGMERLAANGEIPNTLPDCKLTHTYAPIDENYGCGTYARQMFIPKGTLIIGKIHRHQHLNFIMQGKVSVSTEFGPKFFTAPCVFVSEVGLKRAVIAEEDTIWVTVHITKHLGEENLDKMEEEIISPTYQEIGFIDSMQELQRLSTEGDIK
jgi:quercetin dioxygenase-like cupin family protein